MLYKVRTKTAPRYFKDSNDVGTITIRYVVQGLNEKNTRLQIDAIVEDGRRKCTRRTVPWKRVSSRKFRIS